MPRPHEPHADAIRTARRILDEAGGRLVQAIREAQPEAIADACQDLVIRIAQAIVDADRAATAAARDDADASELCARLEPHAPVWPVVTSGAPR